MSPVEVQDTVIKRRLEVDERPLKKLAKAVMRVASMEVVHDITPESAATSAEFDNYEHTLRRLSLLTRSNQEEIHRYEAEKHTINTLYVEAASEIDRLKSELATETQIMLDRKSYDALALHIQNVAPRSRQYQQLSIAKLEEEIAELSIEQDTYSTVWHMRQQGFQNIMDKLTELQRAIHGEKQDADLRDAAESDDEGAVSNQGDLVQSSNDGKNDQASPSQDHHPVQGEVETARPEDEGNEIAMVQE